MSNKEIADSSFSQEVLGLLEHLRVDQLSDEQIRKIDLEIVNSGVLMEGQFNFSGEIEQFNFDAPTTAEAAGFMERNLQISFDQVISVLDDGSDSGVSLQYRDILHNLDTLYECAMGHLYFVDDKGNLLAIFKMAMWLSIRKNL